MKRILSREPPRRCHERIDELHVVGRCAQGVVRPEGFERIGSVVSNIPEGLENDIKIYQPSAEQDVLIRRVLVLDVNMGDAVTEKPNIASKVVAERDAIPRVINHRHDWRGQSTLAE